MSDWYHSGIEGYCKTAAALAGMTGSGGWSAFGSDLFPSRFDRADKATKTWTLSRFRRGTGNRLSAFEAEWLAGEDVDDNRREERAVDACVNQMIHLGGSDDESDSTLASLLLYGKEYAFAQKFFLVVIPAIEKGFAAEGYHSSDIMRCTRCIDEHVGNLRPGDKALFRNFAHLLVAALVYGPDNPLSVDPAVAETIWWQENSKTVWRTEGSGSVVISQLFSKDFARVGYSERFGTTKTVFFGRSGALEKYIDAGRALFSNERRLVQALENRDKVIFPIAQSHLLTSSTHGALFWQDSKWYFVDFSSNGSSITRRNLTHAVHNNVAEIEPGDMVHLGTSKPDLDKAKPYQHATTILVSLFVDERTL